VLRLRRPNRLILSYIPGVPGNAANTFRGLRSPFWFSAIPNDLFAAAGGSSATFEAASACRGSGDRTCRSERSRAALPSTRKIHLAATRTPSTTTIPILVAPLRRPRFRRRGARRRLGARSHHRRPRCRPSRSPALRRPHLVAAPAALAARGNCAFSGAPSPRAPAKFHPKTRSGQGQP